MLVYCDWGKTACSICRSQRLVDPLLVYCDGGEGRGRDSVLDLQVTWTGGSFVSIL